MSNLPKVVEISDNGEETPVVAHIIELTPSQLCLKKLAKQKTKYNRQRNSSQSEEDRETYQQLINKINDMRYIIKLSNANKNLVNKILTYIEYPQTIQEIQEALIQKIESEEI